MKKKCTICESEFETNFKNKKFCNDKCKKEYKKIYDNDYRVLNKNKIKKDKEIYYLNNKDRLQNNRKNYVSNNKEKVNQGYRDYYKNNKEKCNSYKKEKIKTDLAFKLRMNISSSIWKILKLNKSSKKGESCLKYLRLYYTRT